jgi:hypothetical protein
MILSIKVYSLEIIKGYLNYINILLNKSSFIIYYK